jgi:hypothetical protein
MRGYLRDINKTGLSLIMPSVHFGDPYLMCGGNILKITIEFPNRAIDLQAAPVRFDRFEENGDEHRYLIGARILQISKSDRRYVFQYIKSGGVMPEVMHSIVRRLYDALINRIHVRRSGMRLPLTLSLLDASTRAAIRQPALPMRGHLNDISKTGLSLIIPMVRFNNRYPIGDGYSLRIIVELPNRAVNIQASPVRYHKLEEGYGEPSYLIGARITEISSSDRRRLLQHIQGMKKSKTLTSETSFVSDAKSF